MDLNSEFRIPDLEKKVVAGNLGLGGATSGFVHRVGLGVHFKQ